MSLLLPRIAARVFDTPLMVAEEKATAFLAGLGGRLVDGGVFVIDGAAPVEHQALERERVGVGVVGQPMARGMERQGRRPYSVIDGAAVITIAGTLVHKGSFVGQSSGETSCEGLQAQIEMARADPMVRGVAFEVDSFGGESAGIPETAAMIAKLSAEKPTMAILTDFGCSAAYMLSVPCRQIVMPKLGLAASIGALIIHMQMTGAAEQKGIQATIVRAGALKADGHALEELSDTALARMQARVDSCRDWMTSAVGQYRGRRMSKAQAMATEAQVYEGDDALRLGLVDAVGAPNDAFAEFVKALNRP